MDHQNRRQADCEYIVVGSGAGGGTVASRLAEAGRSVILLEAGGDPRSLDGTDPIQPDQNRLPLDYDVPAFHAFASENEAIKWDFFVNHYADGAKDEYDWKYVREYKGRKVNGILYPRAGTLGGCTAHNAQILIYPHNEDWQDIADTTGDPSWRPDNMRKYFERLENCHHRPLLRWLARIGFNIARHGWKGWLHTEAAIPMAAVMRDRKLFRTLADCVHEYLATEGDSHLQRLRWFLESRGDPNDWRLVKKNATGARYIPLTTRDHARMGSRERVLETAHSCRNLRVELHALATRVLFDENMRAIGVEYLHGKNLYRACSSPGEQSGEVRRLYASKEVILAGGAFNTPQLLMLSGIGPREILESENIKVLVDLPGVGLNLQDRYEISVVSRMTSNWSIYKGVKFTADDPQYRQWAICRSGVYTTNGAVLSAFKRSRQAEGAPDLFCMALLTNFQGYYPNYSQSFPRDLDCLTWVVLKAHTRNRAGRVTLRSADPRDTPCINFHYFEQGGDEDLEAVVEGIQFVRDLTSDLTKQGAVEVCPGESVDTTEKLKEFIRNNAWGHHASCTCRIGRADDKAAVLDSNFQVYGTRSLRVVDASVFPRIPGVFIVGAVYMIAEKAADVILHAQ